MRTWLVDNSERMSIRTGMNYRQRPDMLSKDHKVKLADYGTTVEGEQHDDHWLKVNTYKGLRYLPIRIDGQTIMKEIFLTDFPIAPPKDVEPSLPDVDVALDMKWGDRTDELPSTSAGAMTIGPDMDEQPASPMQIAAVQTSARIEPEKLAEQATEPGNDLLDTSVGSPETAEVATDDAQPLPSSALDMSNAHDVGAEPVEGVRLSNTDVRDANLTTEPEMNPSSVKDRVQMFSSQRKSTPDKSNEMPSVPIRQPVGSLVQVLEFWKAREVVMGETAAVPSSADASASVLSGAT